MYCHRINPYEANVKCKLCSHKAAYAQCIYLYSTLETAKPSELHLEKIWLTSSQHLYKLSNIKKIKFKKLTETFQPHRVHIIPHSRLTNINYPKRLQLVAFLVNNSVILVSLLLLRLL